MAEFTFLELHLDDATITNNAPYSGVERDAQDGGAGSGRSVLGVAAIALLLAGIAVAAKLFLADEDADDALV